MQLAWYARDRRRDVRKSDGPQLIRLKPGIASGGLCADARDFISFVVLLISGKHRIETIDVKKTSLSPRVAPEAGTLLAACRSRLSV